VWAAAAAAAVGTRYDDAAGGGGQRRRCTRRRTSRDNGLRYHAIAMTPPAAADDGLHLSRCFLYTSPITVYTVSQKCPTTN